MYTCVIFNLSNTPLQNFHTKFYSSTLATGLTIIKYDYHIISNTTICTSIHAPYTRTHTQCMYVCMCVCMCVCVCMYVCLWVCRDMNNPELLWLPTDNALVRSPEFRPYFSLYANDQGKEMYVFMFMYVCICICRVFA
jgi:hypothetical protein